MAKERRKIERELALYGLFGMEFNGQTEPASEIIENFTDDDQTKKLKKTNGVYADKVMLAFYNNKERVDELIEKYLSTGWTLDRIAKIDKAILRLAVTEMLFTEELIPKEIAINEAVELAKKYGQEDSRKYINALLSNLIRNEKQE